VGIDRPDDADVPSDNPDDRPSASGHDGQHPAPSQAETRYREEYYSARTQVAQQATQADTWTETADQARWMWGEYQRRWPPEDRPPADRSTDPPGSWRSDSNRYLDTATKTRIETECARIVEREQEKISPAIRDIESQDPTRHLTGLEHRRKSRDRIKEKVHDNLNEYSLSLDQAVSFIPDAIRYTFQYEEVRYTQGVQADIVRLKGKGFTLDKLKNSWADDQYKGINSQWIEHDTGQRFEVQFHTKISLEAKQLTHDAYARLRTLQTDKFEEMVLEAFQKRVSGKVPVPPGATEIPDYKREVDAR
jgi:hypothetical protein